MARGRQVPTAILVGVLVATLSGLLTASLTRKREPRKPTLPGAGEVPARRTGLPVPEAWARERYDVAMLVLDEKGVPDAIRSLVARALVAQWAHETARGKSEWNYNVGGMIRRSGKPWFRKRGHPEGPTGQGAPQTAWSAFLDPEDGVRQHIELLQRRHRRAWEQLLAAPDDPSWIFALRRSGYYTASAQAYASAWEANLTWVNGALDPLA